MKLAAVNKIPKILQNFEILVKFWSLRFRFVVNPLPSTICTVDPLMKQISVFTS